MLRFNQQERLSQECVKTFGKDTIKNKILLIGSNEIVKEKPQEFLMKLHNPDYATFYKQKYWYST